MKIFRNLWVPMNEYDTELIKTILMKENLSLVDNEHDADVVMLNTCSVRKKVQLTHK